MLLLISNLTDIDSLNYTVLSHITIIETTILFVEVVVFMFTIYIAVQLPFHWNLRTIITVILIQYYVSLSSRLLLLAVQMNVIPLQGAYETSTLVLWCSLCRMYYFATCCSGIIMIFFERCIASFYIVDYETKCRRHIGIGISVHLFVVSIISSFMVTYEYVPLAALGISMVMFTITALIMFLLLLRRNQRRYNRLVLAPAISNETTMQYTLSLRFQLEENIRSMKLLRNLLILCTTMHTTCFVLLCGAHIDWMHFHCNLIACYYDAVLNLTISIYAILIPLVAYCSGNIYRTLTRSIPIIGRLFRESKVTSTRKVLEEGNVYFTSLNKQWG